MKVICSKYTKAVLSLIILAFTAIGGYFLTYFLSANGLGCYVGQDWYDTYATHNLLYDYANNADHWYSLNEKILNNQPLSFSEKEWYEGLTKYLSQSSVGILKVDEYGNKTGIAGFVDNGDFIKLKNKIIYRENGNGNYESCYEIYFNPNSQFKDDMFNAYNMYKKLNPEKLNYIFGIVVSFSVVLIAYILSLVSCARTSAGELRLITINKIPLEILAFILFLGFIFSIFLSDQFLFIRYDEMYYILNIIGSVGLCSLFLLVLLLVYVFVAQIKNKMLIKSTLCYKIIMFFVRNFTKASKGISKAYKSYGEKKSNINFGEANSEEIKLKDKKDFSQIYEVCSTNLNKGSADIKEKMGILKGEINNLTDRLDIGFKVAFSSVLILLAYQIPALFFGYFTAEWFIYSLLFDIVVFIITYIITMHLKTLQDGAQHLAQGDFDYKIPVENLKGEILNHAQNLNAISDGMMIAVEERLKSERMKYELLTNVSHDIKTPLTSIINYVDLLKSQPMETEEAKEYIEVLDRQSSKLKKLITDLIEVSKASTGNITVNSAPMELKELLTQCLGEYDSRFKEKNLDVVTSIPNQPVEIVSDGRLLWRVFDNILGNIFKYALENTRIYIDLEANTDVVIIKVKNISESKLNISADELMERFVRGDSSRTTEGSGLGLSIAKSLTELMNGQFKVEVDGDLFKVIIKLNK